MENVKASSHNEEVLAAVNSVSTKMGTMSDNVTRLESSYSSLYKEVNRSAEEYNKLALEHNALINKVNSIDMRITIIEETTKIQTKHNEQIHTDFKNGLNKMENSLDSLTAKLDDYFKENANSVKNIDKRITSHTIAEEKWQKSMYQAGMLIGFTGLIAVLGFLGRWAFLVLVAA